MRPDSQYGMLGGRGFTLLELLLVLGILVTLSLFAGPRVGRRLEHAELKAEAERLQTAMSHLRLRAIQTGQSHLFRYLPGAADYQMQALQSDEVGTVDFEYPLQQTDALTSETDPLAAGLAGGSERAQGARLADWMGADQQADSNVGANASELADAAGNEVQSGQLAGGLVFLGPGEELLEPNAEEEMADRLQNGAESGGIEALLGAGVVEGPEEVSEGDWSMPILFFPDGHAQDAHVTVVAPSGDAIRVTVVGMTGRARAEPRMRLRSQEQADVTQAEFNSLAELEEDILEQE